jgi:hypothetical protein
LDIESLFNNEESINNLGESSYQGLADSIMVELQQKYNLRNREKHTTNVPPKNILSRNKMNEAEVPKPPTETQVSWTKPIEIRTTQTKKPKNIEEKMPTKETKKKNRRFQFRKRT